METGSVKKNHKSVFSLIILLFFGFNGAYAQGMSLDDAIRNLNSDKWGSASLNWDPFLRSGILNCGNNRASFIAGYEGEKGPVVFNNRDVMDLPLPYTDKGALVFPDNFIKQVKNSFNFYEEEDKNRFKVAAIIIDPGHGGKDPGAVGKHFINGKNVTLFEKDINLQVSKLLFARLSGAFPDKKIVLTRDKDVFLSLDERAVIANSLSFKENETAIFISVHVNSSFNKTAKGFEMYYLYPDFRRIVIDQKQAVGSEDLFFILNDMAQQEITNQSITMAKSILDSFIRSFGNTMYSREIKERDYYVIKNTKMPAVLVELAFITNEDDTRLLMDEAYLIKFSEALYKGISDFVTLYER